jgi:hypothetical protein
MRAVKHTRGLDAKMLPVAAMCPRGQPAQVVYGPQDQPQLQGRDKHMQHSERLHISGGVTLIMVEIRHGAEKSIKQFKIFH